MGRRSRLGYDQSKGCASMKSGVIAAVLALLLVGCESVQVLFGSEADESEVITQHVRIDDAVIDKELSISIIDPVWWTAEIHRGEAVYHQSLAGFSREQRLVYAVTWYAAEIDNGGHEQFYSNATGIVWKDALAGLREMGVDEAAIILEESAKRMGGDPSLDTVTRAEQMDTYQPEFQDLDDRFYELEERINLEAVLQKYIRQHRTAFYYEGEVRKPKLFSK